MSIPPSRRWAFRRPSSCAKRSIAAGGTIANIGVHGTKVDLHLEKLWDRNITITTRLVDTASTPMLLNILRSNRIDPKLLITHRFKLDQILDAYETFGNAADDKGAQGDHRGVAIAATDLYAIRDAQHRSNRRSCKYTHHKLKD